MITRIGPRKGRLFLREWREARKLTLQQVADRLEVDRSTIQRHEKEARKLTTAHLAELAEALGCEPQDLWRHPDQPTQEELYRGLSDLPPEMQRQVLDLVAVLKRTAASR